MDKQKTLNNDELPIEQRNCHDAILGIVQLALINQGVIEIHCDYNPDCNLFQVDVLEKGEYRRCLYQSPNKLLRELVWLNAPESLNKLLKIEDKLLELIAEAKDKLEVAA